MSPSIPKIAECYPFLINCSGVFGGNGNIGNTVRMKSLTLTVRLK